MYDINDTYNDIKGTLAKPGEKIRQYKYAIQDIMRLCEKLTGRSSSVDSTSAKKAAADKFQKGEYLSGHFTDIALIDNDYLPDLIDSIPDEDIKNAVIDNFNKAEQEGFVKIDYDKKTINLTDKGAEYTNSPEFIKTLEKNQLEHFYQSNYTRKGQALFYVELKGNANDLDAFRYTNEIDLKLADKSNSFERVNEQFKYLQKKGYVTISPDGVVRPTEKLRKYLNKKEVNPEFTLQKVEAGELKNLRFDNHVSTRPPISAANASVKEGAKNAVKESAKTAAKTGASAGVKTGTAAASGAATAGVGTVITVAADTAARLGKEFFSTVTNTMPQRR
ncbi:MAG: hypothetical protein ACI4I4_07380 [Acutalibacteraceae bacterium]